jgi:hypothetical protein
MKIFAPDEVWNALFICHARLAVKPKLIYVIPFSEIDSNEISKYKTPAFFSAIKDYWSRDFNFLVDHYILSGSQEWIVRLDQDVTFFAGEKVFMGAVVGILGGINNVIKIMEDDFSPGVEDKAGLRKYIHEVVGLNAVAPAGVGQVFDPPPME